VPVDVLIFGETFGSPELRRELPVHLILPGLYAERDGRRYAFFDWLERSTLEGLAGVEFRAVQELGFDDLVRELGTRDALQEVVVRACREIGFESGVVPRNFPLELADLLRQQGIEVRADGQGFDLRRRSKTPEQVEGIRRAQRGAEAGMTAIQEALVAGVRSCQKLKAIASHAFADAGCRPETIVLSHGFQTADPLDHGSGEIEEGEPIIVDLFPRDTESWCFADMTRTFCLGTPPPRLAELYRACDEARQALIAAIKPGVSSAKLAELGCDVLRGHGYRTFLDAGPDETPTEGALHMFSHGVGLEIIEEPLVWIDDTDLVAGDVISVEPALYYPGWGGCRIEDLVHVTEEGAELLTQFPYELELIATSEGTD
jgi:Xaa-Pro aminopeptidase